MVQAIHTSLNNKMAKGLQNIGHDWFLPVRTISLVTDFAKGVISSVLLWKHNLISVSEHKGNV
jgi:hypothetical protein